jgi:hypothetical protein
MAKFHVPVEQLADVRSWFANRGGVLMWTNKEIGNSRPEVLTPKTTAEGKPATAPHWAYIGEPVELKPEDLAVRTETTVDPPVDWFPTCEHCKGTGRRSLANLAEARSEPAEVTHAAIVAGTISVNNYNGVDEFDCTWCQGTGHVERHLTVAVRRKYWGYDISETGKARAAKYAKRLGDGVRWTWEHVGYGLAELKFYREHVEPFVL